MYSNDNIAKVSVITLWPTLYEVKNNDNVIVKKHCKL